ncbi:RHS repeat-associated core domain-containing protein [Thiothrix eikelboomii]|nr:RHS repeat-associated core domain-containing protein [Thiothrix eikelboomii]
MSTSQLVLFRQFSSVGVSPGVLGGWQHNYNTSLDAGGIPITEWQGVKSSEYSDAKAACESGWQQISGTAYNGQLQIADAVFNAGLCELKLNGTTVARLPVQGSDGNSSYPIHILTRADGSRITFYEQDGEWATTTREPYQLESTARGWSVTTPDGSVESYNLAGKPDSITNPQGQTTTLSYYTSTSLSAGQLEKVTSPFGQSLTFSYTYGKLTQAKSAAGTTTYTYGADGKLSQVTLSDGSTHSYTYTDGKLDSITDATGAVVARYTYDQDGRVIHSEAAAGTQARAFAYNGAETSVTDVANATTDTYAHRIIQGLARATRSTDSAGATDTTEYDANGYPTKSVDKNGLVTLITWNARGLPESTTTAAGTAQARTTLTEWHPHFRKPIKTIEAGKVTLYEYDANGRLINTTKGTSSAPTARLSNTQINSQLAAMRRLKSRSDIQASGLEMSETSIAYNRLGQSIVEVAENGALSTKIYDAHGNHITTVNALGHTRKILKYDAAGRVLRSRDINGVVTESHYDAGGRLISITSNGKATHYEYDRAGRETKVTYADGSIDRTIYDSAGNISSTITSQGNTTMYTYDANNNQLSESISDVTGQVVRRNQREYNDRNQLTKLIDSEGHTSIYSYDKVGNQTSAIDALGRVTTYEYDAQNRLVKSTDPAGGVTQYAYDANGNRILVVAANGTKTTYLYDDQNHVVSETSADRGDMRQTYDISENLKSSTDANGNQVVHSYDLLNRKVKTTWSDGSTAIYTYDACHNGIGRLCQLTDSSGSTTYGYDSEGHVVRKVQSIGDISLVHSYRYTVDGKLQSETLPSGRVVSYTYAQDKLLSISLNGKIHLSHIVYNAIGQVTSWQWSDGTSYRKTYDAMGRLKSFPLGHITRTLAYDAVSHIISWSDRGDSTKTKRFRYDVLGRLAGYSTHSESQVFQYDANGNRTVKTNNGLNTFYGIQADSNRLVSMGSMSHTLDANGNLLNDGEHSYTYNAQNRLASVDDITNYTYNADEQRVKKVVGQTTTYYAWDNDQIIGEYVQGVTGLQSSETIYLGSTPIALIQNGNIYRIYADQIDTPRVITDATGKTVWTWDSKPFGETLPDTDPDKDGLSLHYNQRFPGQTYDAETGLHYNFHRDYNPQTGRYVQSDPIGLDGGMNSFGYVEGSPAVAWDMLGHAPTYIKGTLNRTIDISLDIHNDTTDIDQAISIMRMFPKIKFTVYIFGEHMNSAIDLRDGGAKIIGLHINPVNDSAATMIQKVNAFYRGSPASIHGSATTTTLASGVMSALVARGAPFVRAAGPKGNSNVKPRVVPTFSEANTISSIQKDPTITHYFGHPNRITAPVKSVLSYFNQNAL